MVPLRTEEAKLIGSPAWLRADGPPPGIITPELQCDLESFMCKLGALEIPAGTSVSSWWRSVERNRRVGGHPNSQHLVALAVDLVVPEGQLSLFQNQLRQLGLHFLIEADHVHVQYGSAGFAVASGFIPNRA